jgi:hypothetical protein
MSLFMLAAHFARQSQTTTAGFSGFFEGGVRRRFWKLKLKKGTRSPRWRSGSSVCGRGVPS